MPPIFKLIKAPKYKGLDNISKNRIDDLEKKFFDPDDEKSIDLLISNIRGKLYFAVINRVITDKQKKEELKSLFKNLDSLAICYTDFKHISNYTYNPFDECNVVAYLIKQKKES